MKTNFSAKELFVSAVTWKGALDQKIPGCIRRFIEDDNPSAFENSLEVFALRYNLWPV
jgi:hypothetical protein